MHRVLRFREPMNTVLLYNNIRNAVEARPTTQYLLNKVNKRQGNTSKMTNRRPSYELQTHNAQFEGQIP